jgi:hypothetical protein
MKMSIAPLYRSVQRLLKWSFNNQKVGLVWVPDCVSLCNNLEKLKICHAKSSLICDIMGILIVLAAIR